MFGENASVMVKLWMHPIACFALLFAAAAGDACLAQDRNETPLQVEIQTQLDFSRAASGGGGGQISVDPNSEMRSVEGDLVDLGGSALAGSAMVRGEPGRAVRIDLPRSVRMTGSSGGVIDIENLRTNLPPAPRLDGFGQLQFSFGGDLRVSGSIAGTFRGRIPITAEYE
jgi:Domain of unknown function (DUF4402)